jgi:hypothetical protein
VALAHVPVQVLRVRATEIGHPVHANGFEVFGNSWPDAGDLLQVRGGSHVSASWV